MVARLDKTIGTTGRHTEYTKLWRVDGAIALSRWKSLIHHHFRDNALVAEYLGLESEAPTSGVPDPHDVAEPPEGTAPATHEERVEGLLPPRMDAGDSVRLLVSLHELDEAWPAHRRQVRPLEDLVDGDRRLTVVDADTSEVEKLLRRNCETLFVPGDATRLAFEDRYHTFPLIEHDCSAAVPATIAAFATLFSAWRQRGDDRIVAISLCAPVLGRELRLAAVGHIQDVGQCLDDVAALFRCTSNEEICSWVNATAERLATGVETTGMIRSDGIVDRLMTPQATFRLSRTMIKPQDIQLAMSGSRPTFQLRIPLERKDLLDAVRAERIRPALAWIIRHSICIKCDAEYVTCPCSKYVDDGAGQRCTDAEIAYPFWTDRPA